MSKILQTMRNVVTLGCSPQEGEASNRITVFTNIMSLLGVVIGIVLNLQLSSLGIPFKYSIGILILTPLGMTMVILNAYHKLFLARLGMLFFGTVIGWHALIMFGKTFNGYTVLYVMLFYSVLAFSREALYKRLSTAIISFTNLLLVDWFFHSRIPPIAGLDSRDLPLHSLIPDTILFGGSIIIMTWVEKSWADRYEDELQKALEVIKSEKQRIQVIFDSVNQGILVIDSNMKIQSQFSAKTKTIFPGHEIAGANILDLLFKGSNLSLDQQSTVKTSLDFCIGEDVINWEMNKDHFPTEIEIRNDQEEQVLALSWSPLVQEDEVKQVVLSIEDITAKKQAELEKKRMRIMDKNKEVVFSIYSKVGKEPCHDFIESLKGVSDLIKGEKWRDETLTLKRNLHSLKGEARLLELETLSTQIHQMEELVGMGDLNSNAEGVAAFIAFSEGLFQAQEDLFKHIEGNVDEGWNLYSYLFHLKQKVEKQLSEVGLHVEAIEFSDGVKQWPQSYRKSIQGILLHSFQNSVDHGYVIPKLNRDIQLQFKTKESNDKYLLEISDFGNGLNMEKIQSKFDSLPDEVKSKMSSPTDVLFVDDFSTADVVTQTSGRGVGLSAVYGEVLALNGSISIENRQNGPGALIRVELPKISNGPS